MNLMDFITVNVPVHMGELITITGAKPQEIKAEVRRLRMQHNPIVSGNEGYRMAKNREELKRYINTKSKVIESEIQLLGKLIETLESMEG